MSFAIPSKLADALAEKRLILFVGAGMSMPQLPGWEKLLREMLASGVDGLSAAVLKTRVEIQAAIDTNRFLEAARLLREGMEPRDFCEFLNEELRTRRGDTRHKIAARLPLAAILTTNFDTFLEDAFAEKPDVLNQKELPELTRALQGRRFCVVHMHGEVTDSQSVVLTTEDYEALKRDRPFAHFVHTLSTMHTLLFVGYGLQDDELLLFLNQAYQAAGGLAGPHYAFVRSSDVTEARRVEFDEKYGIRFLEDSSGGYPDIANLLVDLEATLPVPAAEAADVEALFEEWGWIGLQRVPSEGRLLFKAVRENRMGKDELAALAYVNREANESDFRALKAFNDADLRVLIGQAVKGAALASRHPGVYARGDSRSVDSVSAVFAGDRDGVPQSSAGPEGGSDRRILRPAEDLRDVDGSPD